MLDPALDVADPPATITLIPGAVEFLSRRPELHNEIAGEVLGLGLAPFLAPRRIRAASSLPMMIRASEPPIKERRSTFLRHLIASVTILCIRNSKVGEVRYYIAHMLFLSARCYKK